MSEVYCEMLSSNTDLVFSPDDGGWYLHNYETDEVSQLFDTDIEAKKALASNTVEWEK